MNKNKITFSREALAEFKNLFLKAIVSGHSTFVHKGSLVDVNRAEVLINKFKPHFVKNVNEVTLDYDF